MKLRQALRPTLLALAWALMAHAAQAQAPAEAAVTYTVQPRDNLIGIAGKVLASPESWPEVARLNGMQRPNSITVGQKIQIPLRLMKWVPSQASLTSATGDVKINGLPATAGATVSEGDRLEAGASSSALISLQDGSRIQVMPGSLAELVNHRQYGLKDGDRTINWFSGLLRLTKGAVEALVTPGVERAAPLRVITPTSVVGVRGTHFRVAIDAQDRSEVMEGLVVAENTTQAVQAELPAGNGAVIRPEVKNIEVRPLLAAPDLSAAPAQAHERQPWAWPASAGAEAWRVQLAADAGFNQIFFERKVAAPSLDVSAIPRGQWHARVRGIDSVGLEGFDARRTIEIVAAPAPTWTLSRSTLSFRGGTTRLSWAPAEPALQTGVQWRAQVLKADGVAVSAPLTFAPGPFTELHIAPGTYSVRIDGQDAQGTPFLPQRFQLQVPDGWGSQVRDVIDPLQPSR